MYISFASTSTYAGKPRRARYRTARTHAARQEAGASPAKAGAYEVGDNELGGLSKGIVRKRMDFRRGRKRSPFWPFRALLGLYAATVV